MSANPKKNADHEDIQEHLKDVFANTLNIYGGLEAKFVQRLNQIDEVNYLDKTSAIRIRRNDLVIEFSISTNQKTYNDLGGLIFNGTGLALTDSLLDSTLLEMVNTLAGQFRSETAKVRFKYFTQELPWIEKNYPLRDKNIQHDSQWIGLFETQIGLFCLNCSFTSNTPLLETKQLPIFKTADIPAAISPLIAQGFDFFMISGPVKKLDINSINSDNLDLTSIDLLYVHAEGSVYNNSEIFTDRWLMTAFKGFKTYFNYQLINLDTDMGDIKYLGSNGSIAFLQCRHEALPALFQNFKSLNLHITGGHIEGVDQLPGINFNGKSHTNQIFIITPRDFEMMKAQTRNHSGLKLVGPAYTVTECKGAKILKLDNIEALEVLKTHVQSLSGPRDESFLDIPLAIVNDPNKDDKSAIARICKINKYNHEDHSIYATTSLKNGDLVRFLSIDRNSLVDSHDSIDKNSLFEFQFENSDRFKLLKDRIITNKVRSLAKAHRLIPILVFPQVLGRNEDSLAGEQDLTKLTFELKVKKVE